MAKPKKKSLALAQDEHEVVPLGEAYGGDGTGGGAYKMPAATDWNLYDQYVSGRMHLELAHANNMSEVAVQSEIDLFRDQIRMRYPGVTDSECDDIRLESLAVMAGLIDGSAPGIKLAMDARVRRRSLQQAGASRAIQREKQGA